MFLEIIIQNNDSADATLEDLQEWQQEFNMTMPVLSDTGSSVWGTYASGGGSLPYTVLLDRGVVVQEGVGTASISQMDELLGE